MKPVVQINITVGESGREDDLRITTNKSYQQNDADLRQAFLDARDYLNDFGHQSQKLFDMFDQNIIFIDRQQVTAYDKSEAMIRLNNEYNNDGPLKFYPDEHAVHADALKGTVKGPATWEDAHKKKEPLQYDFRFKYIGGTWILLFVHSKP